MAMASLNPATGDTVQSFETWDGDQLNAALQQVADATPDWQRTSFDQRGGPFQRDDGAGVDIGAYERQTLAAWTSGVLPLAYGCLGQEFGQSRKEERGI